jgi:hypothetical protein
MTWRDEMDTRSDRIIAYINSADAAFHLFLTLASLGLFLVVWAVAVAVTRMIRWLGR